MPSLGSWSELHQPKNLFYPFISLIKIISEMRKGFPKVRTLNSDPQRAEEKKRELTLSLNKRGIDKVCHK